MYERHQREQYFFDPPTLTRLADFAGQFARPCCLCAPLVARELAARGHWVRLLEIDERFAALPGYRRYDLYRPDWLDETYDLILCDPPFFRVSHSQLFTALRTLSHFNFSQPLLLCHLTRRAPRLLGTLALFNLAPTGYFPAYQTVDTTGKSEIEFFSNLPADQLRGLAEDDCNSVSRS